MEAWLAPELRPELSQGDIVDGLVFLRQKRPARWLGNKDAANNVSRWCEGDDPIPHQSETHILALGTICRAMVLSHDCEIDNSGDRARILVAPVLPWANLRPDLQEKVRQQAFLPLMPLSLPDGNAYMDLRSTTYVDHRWITTAARKWSLSERGRERLHTQLVGFYANRIVGPAIALSATCGRCGQPVIVDASRLDGNGVMQLKEHLEACSKGETADNLLIISRFEWQVAVLAV